MRQIVLLAVFGLGLGLIGQARADIPPPLPPAKEAVTVKIEVDEKAKGPRLVVPNGVFTSPRVRPFPKKPDAPKGALEQEGADGIAGNEPDELPRHQVMIAGVALAMSLGFGGLWLVRRNGRGSIGGLSLLIAAVATLSIGAVVWANGAPPPNLFKERPVKKIESFPVALEGKASVEFVYGGEPVRLILDKESYEKLKKGELAVPAPTPK